MREDFMFTSESVTEGHPDKLCDQISDAIVDGFLQQDRFSSVRAECAASTGILFIAARFASRASVDIPELAREVINDVGYRRSDFNAKTCSIMMSLTEQPEADYRPFDERELDEVEMEQITVKNQVTAFGFACNQTPVRMPLPAWLAHRLARQLSAVRRDGRLRYLAPDGKTQVGIEFRNRRPHRVHTITVISSQLTATSPAAQTLHDDLIEQVIEPVFAEEELKVDARTRIFINPDGPMIRGGPALHSGLTGRKTAIDTYGEYSRHSGAALSGKDPGRIDRIGAYAARHAAKNVVAAGLAQECEVQLSYSIGLTRPVSVHVETFGTGRVSDGVIAERLSERFDFRLAGILRRFALRDLPAARGGRFYRHLAAYGHMGRADLEVPWEGTDAIELLAE